MEHEITLSLLSCVALRSLTLPARQKTLKVMVFGEPGASATGVLHTTANLSNTRHQPPKPGPGQITTTPPGFLSSLFPPA